MPDFIQKKPQLNRERDDGMYDDASQQAAQDAQAARQRAGQASARADGLLGGIDDLLGENSDDAVYPSALEDAESGLTTSADEDDEDALEDADEDEEDEEESLFREEASGMTASDQKFATRLRARLASRKRLWWGLGGLGGIVVIVLIIFTVLFASLKLPNLTENIIGYQFARLSRAYSTAGDRITDETLAKRAAQSIKDNRVTRLANDLRDKATGLKDGTVGKVKGVPGVTNMIEANNTYNPLKVQKNLRSYGIAFDTTKDGRLSVTLTGQAAKDAGVRETKFYVEKPSTVGRFIPGYRQFLRAQSNNALVTNDTVRVAINNGLRLNDSPTWVRGAAMNSLLKRLGINRVGFAINRFKAADDDKLKTKVANEETRKATSPKSRAVNSNGPANEAINSAAEDEEKAIKAAEADKTGVKSVLLSNDGTGINNKVSGDLAQSATHGTISSLVGQFSSIYSVAYLACVFNEGADANDNAAIMDANNDSNERNFVQLAGVSDLQKNGAPSNDQVGAFDNGIAAFNNKVGDNVENSNPYLKANGSAFNTASETAAQSTGYGFLPPEVAIGSDLFWSIMQSVKPTCPVISSAWTAGAVALASIVKDLASAGGGVAADAGAEAAGQIAEKTVIRRITSNLAARTSQNFGRQAGLKLALKNSVTKPAKLLGTFIKNGVVVVSVESLGAFMGASHSTGVNNNGYESGNTYVNKVDAGGNALAQEQCQRMQFCRPLTRAEVCESNADDIVYLDKSFKSQSPQQRYLATDNYRSLLSQSIMKAGSGLHGPIGKQLLSLSSVLTKPGSLFGSIFKPFGSTASAASIANGNCDADSAYYGNTQFGWSRDEDNLINSDPSYQPDENLAILASSGQAPAIANKYAKCFGKIAHGDELEDDPDATLGHLLSGDEHPDIRRDEHGDVINDPGSLCSPIHLSYNNVADDFAIDANSDSPQKHDLVFRWRLANRYENTQNQLSAVANVTANGAANVVSGGSGQ